MAGKGVSRKGKKGKKPAQKKYDTRQTLNQECDSSSAENVNEHKMDTTQDTVNPKGKGKKGTRGKKGAKKSHQGMEIEPVAGPSGLCRPPSETVIETSGSMVVCKYKRDKKVVKKPVKPYEVMWGNNFLNKLVPKVKQQKSILKTSSTEKKVKPRTRFSQTTVYYFERVKCRSRIPSEGDVPLGMEPNHFYAGLFPVDVYEQQRVERLRREQAASNGDVQDEDMLESEGEPSDSEDEDDQDSNIRTIQVPAELMEVDDIANGSVQNVPKGCSCNLYCDPDLCDCNLRGKQCEVFMDGFPCGCKMEYCKNSNGRREFNDRYVRRNLVSISSSVSRIKEIKGGRVNKRKRFTPVRYGKY